MKQNAHQLIVTQCAFALSTFKKMSLKMLAHQVPAKTEHPKTPQLIVSASHHQRLTCAAHVISAPSAWKGTRLTARALNPQMWNVPPNLLKMSKNQDKQLRSLQTLAIHLRKQLKTALLSQKHQTLAPLLKIVTRKSQTNLTSRATVPT